METYPNGVIKLERKNFVKIGRWEYGFFKGNDTVDGFHLAHNDYYDRLIKEKPDPLPFFIISTDYASGIAGSQKGRVWISIRGNFHFALFFPKNEVIKTNKEYSFFSNYLDIALIDVLNKYAPNTFTCKFPNDIVCIEHESKICGINEFVHGDYLCTFFYLNSHAAPPEELLRAEGLKACCLKNHMKDIPPPEKFIIEVGNRMLELNEELGNDSEKYLAKFNECFRPCFKKKYKMEFNNREADTIKDGLIWCTQCPNALFKGYLNEQPYEFDSCEPGQLWDSSCYRMKGPNDPDYIETLRRCKEYEDKVNKNYS